MNSPLNAEAELQKLKQPTVMMLVSEFYDHRDAVADTFERGRQKAKGKNLKKRAEIYSYLQENQIGDAAAAEKKKIVEQRKQEQLEHRKQKNHDMEL